MFFEVNITPKEKVAPVHADLEVNFNLLLAPFQPQTRIRIETALNTTACCYLGLKNPSSRPLNVQVTKKPPAERSVTLSLSQLKIEPESEEELVISWTAREPGTFRDIIQLTDSRRIKYDIALTTSTISTKKNVGGGRLKENNKGQLGETTRKILVQNISPKKKSEPKRVLNLADNVISPSKRYKPSISSRYQGKENVSTHPSIDWQTPKKSSSSILGHRQEKSSDISAGKLRDFSMLIESDTFALTPPPWFRNDDQSKPENSSSENLQFRTQSYTALLSPTNSGTRELRRATYTTAPACKNITFTNEDVKVEFEDSLSPPATKANQNYDFSMLINDLNFTSANTPAHGVANKAEIDLQNGQLPGAQFATPGSTKNDTFEVIRSPEITESLKNSGNLTTSTENLTTSTENHRLVPTRLSRNFARLSPVMPVVEPCVMKYAMSSSPICEKELGELGNSSCRSRIEGFNLLSRQSSRGGVQDVLEADLWAKPTSQYSFTIVKNGPSSLESIREETPKTTPAPNKTYTKSLDKTQTLNVFSTPISFRSEFSPPKNNNAKKNSPFRKISPKKSSKISKDKTAQEIHGLKKKAAMNTSLKTGGKVSIPGVRVTKLSLSGVARPKRNNSGSSRGFEHEVSMKLHDPDDFFTRLCNPDPFAATMTEDPFLASTLYYDDKWVENQEIEFKKWLNALLTPPEHLTSDVDTPLVDVAKVWQSCRLKEDVSLAETKEAVSARYHTNQRLNTLRRAACTMLRSNEVVTVLSKITVCVEKGNLVIRQDRDLHKDIGLQKLVLELLLCYNPLWLRIGLEAIYGETIPLSSNSDIIRLSKFLLTRFFSDPHIVKTHSHQTVLNLRLPTFLAVMNKFMLKKFLFLLFFLDYAKTRKLIGHDPCLFHKQAAHKESRRILLKFSQELLSGVGDVTRVLKPYGYVLIHKQTELDEYSYGVDNLSHDLRDGVRLCRVMELITGKRNLTAICRVPAISRLQKVYNVDVALKALATSGYVICGNITAKCIADGHREKTLSLLWQLIYRFQAPHFNKAASAIQKWWRSRLWWVRVKNFLLKRKNNAASVIQRAWRSYLARKEMKYLKEKQARILATKNQAARVIQLKWIATAKMRRERKNLQRCKSAATTIQRSWKNYRATKPCVAMFKRKKHAACVIQKHWRAMKSMRLQMSAYLITRDAAIKIQLWWKQKLVQKVARNHYLALQKATRLVQSKWRGNRLMKIERNEYLKRLNAVIVIQEWWRRQLAFREDRNNFLLMKDATRLIEKWWMHHSMRGKLLKKEINAAITIQQRWRAIRVGKQQREVFMTLKKSTVAIQRKWRARRTAKSVRQSYILKRNSAIVLQRRFRAVQIGRQQRKAFETQRKCVIAVQRKWRANKLARSLRQTYISKRNAAMVIQLYWRNWRVVFEQRCAFVSLKAAAICVQDRFRANKAARKATKDFNELKRSVIVLQRKWRAVRIARETRQEFLDKKRAAIIIQRKYKTIIAARRYRFKKQAVVRIQLWWKACLLTKDTKSRYNLLKSTTISIQRKYRARKLSAYVREEFLILKMNVIYIQQKWRAKKLMVPHREDFLRKRKAVCRIQSWWKACLMAKETKSYYDLLKSATIFVQQKYRARKAGVSVREEFLTLRSNVIFVQQKWRANKSMQLQRQDFLTKRGAANKIQIWWKACILTRKTKSYYDELKSATVFVQRKYRALKTGSSIRLEFMTLRINVIYIQQKWRARKLMKPHREEYLLKQRAANKIQLWWRAGLIAKETKSYYDLLKSATIFVQQTYRAKKLSATVRQEFLTLRNSVICIQQKWRANKCREDFLAKRQAVVKIQEWWRAIMARKICQEIYRTQKIAAIQIQRWYRSKVDARIMRETYKKYTTSIESIQNWWRGILSKRQAIETRKQSAATVIQAIWRGYKIRQSQSNEMTKLRERSKKATMEAQPTATLAHRLKVAIVIAQEYENLGKLIQGLTALDTITHLLPQGCIALCEADLVGKLYDLLHRSNRSRPWMDICLRASSILVSITKYAPTKSYAWREEYLETIIRLLTATIERETGVFLHLATLLWLLADSPARIKAIVECPMADRSLSTLYNGVSKKRTRLSSGPKLPPPSCLLPNPKPDWGLKHSRPRLFTSVHHAVTSLCKRLKIKVTTSH